MSNLPLPKTTLPVDREIESAILGTLLYESDAIKLLVGRLRPEHFYYHINSQIYEACQSIFEDGEAITNITVARKIEERTSRGPRQSIRSLLAEMSENALPASATIPYFVDQLIDLYQRRQAINLCKKSLVDFSDASQNVKSVLSVHTQAMFELSAHGEENGHNVALLSQGAVAEALDRLEAVRNGKGISRLIPYPWPAVSKITPLRKGEVTVVCGRPGMAKTSFALNVAMDVALKGVPVGIFSLEMNKFSLMYRFASYLTGISSQDMEENKLNEEQWKRVLAAFDQLKKLPIAVDDYADLDEVAFIAKSREAKHKFGIELIILDYLQLMRRPESGNEAQAVGSCARTIRKMARILDIPIIEISQVSRSCETRPDKRPILSDLRESGEIEQEADVVLALYREGYYDRNSSKGNQAEIIARKHRNGGLGTAYLYFEEKSTRFFEIQYN